MGYKEEMLKKIEAIKEYEKLRVSNPEEAYKFKNQFQVREIYAHVSRFLKGFNAGKDGIFPDKATYDKFISEHEGLLKGKGIPRVEDATYGRYEIPDVDFAAIFDAIEKDAGISVETLENAYKKDDPSTRAKWHPLDKKITDIKKEVGALFDENTAKEIKESLDYANEELIAKTGVDVLEDATKYNSNYPGLNAAKEFKAFVKEKGLDENVVVNKAMGEASISGGAYHESNFPIYKPFLKMDIKFDEDFKKKLIGLNDLLKQEGLLQQAAGGESGTKEYGLVDYFQKNYQLKTAILDQAKMNSEADKKNNIQKINRLAKETKEVSDKYDKIFAYIEKNFDVENMYLPGNLYSGRPSDVTDGNLDPWRPNLPPKYDFENTPKVIFLNGFNQLKAACQIGDVSLEDYLENPTEAYLKGAEKASKISDARYYLPRSEENTLGKRLARTFVGEDGAYPHLAGHGMIGGRAIEFLTATDPNKENKTANIIIGSINTDFSEIYDHSPSKYFGSAYDPEVDNIKNLFAFADKEDDLYKVSSHYHNKDAEKVGINEQYKDVLKEKKDVPVAQEYRRIMDAMQDFARERKYMFEHEEQFTTNKPGEVSGGLVTYSISALLYSGREYFLDYMKENNLSLASIPNEKLREEVTNFITDPVGMLDKNVAENDLDPESIEDIKSNYRSMYKSYNLPSAKTFFEKFNECNNKPNGRNVGKSFTKIVSDNKGSWWERLRGKTSKEYTALQKIAKEACKPGSQCYGDEKALYIAAKAYKDYKMPEGTAFERLSGTAKKRVEFCDSIIDAYQANHPELNAQNEIAPEVNNNVIDQNEFQNQIQKDLNPQQEVQSNKNLASEQANEKDPPDEGIEP